VTAPAVEGGFDLAVDTWDRADARPNKLATYRLEARVDGATTLAFEAVVDSFSWDTTVEVERVYDYAATFLGDETRRTLCKLPSYKESVVRRGPEFWSLPPGTHRIALTAVDEAGNRAVATLLVPVVEPGKGATPAPGRRAPAPGARLRGTVLDLTSPAGEPAPASLVPGIAAADSIRIGATITRTYELAGIPNDAWLEVPQGLAGAAVPPRKSGIAPGAGGYLVVGDTSEETRVVVWHAGDGSAQLELEFPPHALLEPSALHTSSAGDPAAAGDLIPVSMGVDVAPSDLVLRAATQATFQTTAAPAGIPLARTGLFLRQRIGWSFVGAFVEHVGYRGSTRRLGTFAVFADTTAPSIVSPPLTTWRHATADAPPPRLSAVIKDHGAGLAPIDQAIYVDGRRVPAEYDPEGSRLTWYPRAWPAKGRHEVRIEAVDRLGNRSVLTVPLAVD